MNGDLHDMTYDPVESDFESAEPGEETPEYVSGNNNGFSHQEPANSSARTNSTQSHSKCRNVSIAMPRNIKIDDLRLVAKKGPQV